MFWLWNELFGFPVNDCDFESIECNKQYMPVLNWDADNEFTWSLVDPLWWDVDASNITFEWNRQLWADTPVNRVNQALDALKSAVMSAADQESNIISFTLAPKAWEQWVVEWIITYKNDHDEQYEKKATINIKALIEWLDDLALKNITVDELYLGENWVAPDFVLQNEKWVSNWIPTLNEDWKIPMSQIQGWTSEWVATLDSNWKVPRDQLPVEIPRLYFSIWYGVFENSDTCVINDERIHLNSYVNISNYDDIEWDLHEVVWDGWLTVTSNTTETWTFRYLVITPDPAYSNVNVPGSVINP